MLDFDKIGRTAISAIGAILLSTAAIAAAVGPARAIETAPAQVAINA